MTWYRNHDDGTSERIGSEAELIEWLRNERIRLKKFGITLQDRFEEWVNTNFTPLEILEETTRREVGYEQYFTDWVEWCLMDDPDFDEVYGFEWVDEE